MNKPLWKQPAGPRASVLRRFLDQDVVLRWSYLRDADDLETSFGRLVSVAEPVTGAGSTVVVLRFFTADGTADRAYSAATIHSITQQGEGNEAHR